MIDRREVARVGLVAIAAAAAWFHLWPRFGGVDIIGIALVLAGGFPIVREAIANIIERRMTMELSMTIALVAALSIGQTFTALVITAFVLAAEILEHATVSRGRIAIGDLLACLPQTARVRRDGVMRDLAASDLAIGDAVLVDPGALVPVDGTVIAGHAYVDEARITGEAMPAEKHVGSAVFAGTVNCSGALEIRAERLGRETSFGRIIDAVESAEHAQAPIERLADRLAGYLVYVALAAAALTLAITHNIVATISVVIVAGACGIAAGTPLAVLGAIGRAARAGAIVKGGRYLEALAATTVVAFDKTGTITFGTPTVREIRPAIGTTESDLLGVAARAELRSEHPLARAIVARARAADLTLDEPHALEFEAGFGVRAHLGKEVVTVGSARYLESAGIAIGPPANGMPENPMSTDVHVARDNAYLGAFAFDDTIRSEARAAIGRLRALGIRTVLLTGDRRGNALAVGTEIGVDDVVAELLPDEKAAWIGALVDAGTIVTMVGDGINDAPALAAADVGIAMSTGTDVAMAAAGITLMRGDPRLVADSLDVSRRTYATIKRGLFWAFAYNVVGINLAAFGMLNPVIAGAAMAFSSVSVVVNALWLRRWRSSTDQGPAMASVEQPITVAA